MLTLKELRIIDRRLDRGGRIRHALATLGIEQDEAAEIIGRHPASVRKALSQSSKNSPILGELETEIRKRL